MPAEQPVALPPLTTAALTDALQAYPTAWVPLTSLRPHPRNYRSHPDDQLDHITASIRAHGFYRNIVVAQEGTILAGHGVVLAATQLGYTQVPVIRLPLAPDDDRALQILVGDNEMPRLSVNDEQALATLLHELRESDPAVLLGTGFDEEALGTLLARGEVNPPAMPGAGDESSSHLITCPLCGESFVP